MEQIPIGDGERPDNVVPLLGSRTEPGEEPTSPAREPTPEPVPEPAIGPLVEQSARILAGFVSATAAALSDALREVTPHPEPTEDDELAGDEPSATAPPSTFGLTAGAAAGLAIEVSQAAVRAATAFAETAGPLLSWFANAPVVHRGFTDAEAVARDLNERWTRERPVSEEAATAFASKIVPELTNAILDRIDLTQIAIDRIDIDRIVDSIDLDRIIEHIDINEIIGRVDVNAIIDRLDLAALADQVLSEIDLPEIIRGSTNAVTSETVRTVRVQSAKGDRAIARLVDRILRRTAERDVDTHGERP
jgi:hypothetical protein